MNKATIVTACLISVSASLTNAAPTLSNVKFERTGPLETDLVIVGSGFGAKPNVVVFDNFENGRHQQKIQLDSAEPTSTWNSNAWFGSEALYIREPDGNLAHQARDFTKSLSQGTKVARIGKIFDKKYNEAYVAFSVRVPDGNSFPGTATPREFSSRSSWKFSWLMSGSDGYGNPEHLDLTIPTHVGNGSFIVGGNDGNIDYLPNGKSWWSWDQYNHMATHVKFDEEDPENVPVTYAWQSVSDVTFIKSKNTQDPSAFSGTDYSFDRIYFPGWWGNGDNSNFNAYYDNVYVAVGDNSLARVEITDHPEFEKSTYLITVPAKEWSNSKLVLAKDVLPKRAIYYVQVTDADGQRSKPMRVCPVCPGPNTSLSVE